MQSIFITLRLLLFFLLSTFLHSCNVLFSCPKVLKGPEYNTQHYNQPVKLFCPSLACHSVVFLFYCFLFSLAVRSFVFILILHPPPSCFSAKRQPVTSGSTIWKDTDRNAFQALHEAKALASQLVHIPVLLSGFSWGRNKEQEAICRCQLAASIISPRDVWLYDPWPHVSC